MPKILIEGSATIESNSLVVVCGFCNHHERDRALIELNFRQKKVIFICPECKKENEIVFAPETPPPLPRSRMGR